MSERIPKVLVFRRPNPEDGDCLYCGRYVVDKLGGHDIEDRIFCDIHCWRNWRVDRILERIEREEGREPSTADIRIVCETTDSDPGLDDDGVLARVRAGVRYGNFGGFRPKPISDRELVAVDEALAEVAALARGEVPDARPARQDLW